MLGLYQSKSNGVMVTMKISAEEERKCSPASAIKIGEKR